MSDEKFCLVFNLKFKNSLMFTFKKIYESFTTGHVVKQFLQNELNEKMPNFKIERIEQNDECVNRIIELSDFYFFNENKELIVHLIQVFLKFKIYYLKLIRIFLRLFVMILLIHLEFHRTITIIVQKAVLRLLN